jgi:hypothetical protein
MKKLLIIGCIVVALFTGYIIFARNSHAAPRNDEFVKDFVELKKSDQRPDEPVYPPKIVDEELLDLYQKLLYDPHDEATHTIEIFAPWKKGVWSDEKEEAWKKLEEDYGHKIDRPFN